MQSKHFSLVRTSVVFVALVVFGIMVVSTFSRIKMLVMQDIMDSANPNHPTNSPVVYKSKQKNFRTMFLRNFLWFQVRRMRLFTLRLDELINATKQRVIDYCYWNEHIWHRKRKKTVKSLKQ